MDPPNIVYALHFALSLDLLGYRIKIFLENKNSFASDVTIVEAVIYSPKIMLVMLTINIQRDRRNK